VQSDVCRGDEDETFRGRRIVQDASNQVIIGDTQRQPFGYEIDLWFVRQEYPAYP
jgi:hypothetical protein